MRSVEKWERVQEIARKEGNSVACMAPELAIENSSQSVVMRFKVVSRFSRREPGDGLCLLEAGECDPQYSSINTSDRLPNRMHRGRDQL